MNAKAIVTGLLGLLWLATPAFADPPLASTEKAYRLLQAISSQLQEVQTSVAPSGSTPAAAALAKAQEQVRIAAAHCCHDLYVAQLTAAKAALTQGQQQQALHHLLKANETLEKCPAPPVTEPQHDQGEPDFNDALAHR
jgi:hypothetical protein